MSFAFFCFLFLLFFSDSLSFLCPPRPITFGSPDVNAFRVLILIVLAFFLTLPLFVSFVRFPLCTHIDRLSSFLPPYPRTPLFLYSFTPFFPPSSIRLCSYVPSYLLAYLLTCLLVCLSVCLFVCLSCLCVCVCWNYIVDRLGLFFFISFPFLWAFVFFF